MNITKSLKIPGLLAVRDNTGISGRNNLFLQALT
jgi:hypothetical protein